MANYERVPQFAAFLDDAKPEQSKRMRTPSKVAAFVCVRKQILPLRLSGNAESAHRVEGILDSISRATRENAKCERPRLIPAARVADLSDLKDLKDLRKQFGIDILGRRESNEKANRPTRARRRNRGNGNLPLCAATT